MKKVIGILGVAVFSMAMFFSASKTNATSNNDVSLITMFSLNSANAEDCNNNPSINNGDCEMAVNGEDWYCMNSWFWHDCY